MTRPRRRRFAGIALSGWVVVHRWTSLVCTAFLLLLCATGLPLIFHHEIDHALGDAIEAPEVVASGPRTGFGRVLATARARHPDHRVLFASQEPDDDRVWYLTMAGANDDLRQVAVDARDATLLGEPVIGGHGVMAVVRSLHVDLFAGLAGKLFLGAMGVLLLASLVSGTVLYAPFMQRLAFGEVRRGRASRVKWLDLHNLIGIATLTWAFVVGATGVVNTWAELLEQHWQSTALAALPAARPGHAAIDAATAIGSALSVAPRTRIAFVAFPGAAFAGPDHYGVFLRGETPLTSRLLEPVMVDASDGAVVALAGMPWYLEALLLSQPLHFGDYGGLPLKLIWAGLDVATIVVLASGLWLWLARHARARAAAGR